MLHLKLFFFITLHISSVFCSPSPRDISSSPPTVTLDSATVTGINQGGLSKFLGIPFAQPPIGNLRFNLPQAITSYNGSVNASSYGPTCPQQTVQSPVSLSNFFNFSIPFIKDAIGNKSNSSSTPESEDCLTINVITPANVSSDAMLPVLVWIFGGGFERGSAGGYDTQATRIVNRSMELGEPVVYAAMNYRVSGNAKFKYKVVDDSNHPLSFLPSPKAWGFLASQEVQDAGAGNAGLVDQRVALQWVQKYIHIFGGDSSKVTIWGQSAGAISASMQMLAYGGNSSDLFRGAFMQSGAPIPVGNLTRGQGYYDQVVNQTNCASSNDTLSCLRSVPYDTLKSAVDSTPNYFSYQALALAWSPRADGMFLQDNPQRLVQQGKVMNISFVSGNVDDEGTLFSLSSRNVTTDNEFKQYISTNFVPSAPASSLDPLWTYYPSNPSQGSPFNTSFLNDITPQYKRIAAFQGDVVFQAPRRFFVQNLAGMTGGEGGRRIWSYLSWRLKPTPVIGSFHGSDLETNILDDYLVRFVNHLDPNLNSSSSSSSSNTTNTGRNDNDSTIPWPEYTNATRQLYTFPIFANSSPTLSNDTYREDAMAYLMNLSLAYPL